MKKRTRNEKYAHGDEYQNILSRVELALETGLIQGLTRGRGHACRTWRRARRGRRRRCCCCTRRARRGRC
jgi:hypothetical protein